LFDLLPNTIWCIIAVTMDTPEFIPLRRVGGSLYFRIPAPYVNANDLQPGDIAVWAPGDKVRIVKREQLEEQLKELATADE
jgi:antitoxin component of MazEF toxin-antitoxin module